jgi:hypothetical protein
MHEVLFCPFCGEAFEGAERCPEHELRLVPWRALPQSPHVPADDEPLPWQSALLGRGLVAAGAALALLAFVALPLARVDGALAMGGSMLLLALSGTPKLWLVPAAACAQLAILYRRRSAASMRAARLAVAFVACVPALAGLWTWSGASAAVALLAERMQQPLSLSAGAGAYALALSVVLMLLGASRLGRSSSRPR